MKKSKFTNFENMKIFKIESIIETENDWDIDRIKSELDLYFNRGDGAYLEVDKKCKITLIKEVKDK